mgnify:FL=1
MLQFTYARTQRVHPFVVVGVVVMHALAIGTLLLSPRVTALDTQTSIAMEMVLAPVSQTRAAAQAQVQPQPSTTRPSAATPTTQASPSAAPATHSAEATPATAATQATRTSSANTGAPAFILPSSEAHGLNNPKPTYPRLSRRMNEQGQVVIRVFVAADGSPQQGAIKTSSGYDRLDQEALHTVMRWRFVAGQRLGVPEAMWFNVPVNFVLD